MARSLAALVSHWVSSPALWVLLLLVLMGPRVPVTPWDQVLLLSL